ncbi:MAG: AzlC family ABC transporter permease [Clostridiales bacterium]|nr:AzlC family ABC transporter permease [Clostridiales bacterium]
MRSESVRDDFLKGLKDSMPIGLGYLSVSFSFGIMAVSSGLSVLSAVLISLTNLTSAGQVAGIAVIVGGGGYIEMALTQLIINSRYALMSLSLSQKLDKSFTPLSRLLVSYGITDEIFAVAAGNKKEVSKHYMAGLIICPTICWTLGTLMGAVAGEILPTSLKAALGIAIYGMFIAIFVPAVRKSLGVLVTVAIAVVISCCIKYIPIFSGISQGFSIIIATLIAAVIGALVFPVKFTESDEDKAVEVNDS